MSMRPGVINLASSGDIKKAGGTPYDYFAALRAEAPVFWNPPAADGMPLRDVPDYEPIGFWIVSKYDDVATVSKDHARFSAWENGVLWVDYQQNPASLASQRSGLMGMDPPQQTQFRRLVQSGFTPRATAAIDPFIREQSAEVISQLAERDSAEFVFDVASELPMILLCEMMGVPQERRAEYLDIGNRVANIEFSESVEQDRKSLYMLLDDIVNSVKDAPDDTLISKYFHGEIDGRRLTKAEITQFFTTLSIAGHETTRNSTAHFVRLMDEHPDQKALLLEDIEGRMPNAIEEVLRHSPPVMQFCRTATEDLTMRGANIAKGDKIYMSYISANRDEDVFEDPDRFDILRENASKHLAFGTGAHFCLGASLARLQMRHVLTELYTQIPDIALAGEPTPMFSVWFNAITEMPVTTCPVGH